MCSNNVFQEPVKKYAFKKREIFIIIVAIFAFFILSPFSLLYGSDTVEGAYNAIAFSPSGKFLAAGGEKKLIIKRPKMFAETIKVDANITSITATDEIVMAGTSKNELFIYNAAAEKVIQTDYFKDVKKASASHKFIAVLFINRKLKIIDRKLRTEVAMNTNAIEMAFKDERLYVFDSSGALSELDPTTGKILSNKKLNIGKQAVFSGNSKYIAVIDKMNLNVYQVEDGMRVNWQTIRLFDYKGDKPIAITNNGKLVAVPGCMLFINVEDNTASTLLKENFNCNDMKTLAFSYDDKQFAFADSKNLQIVDMENNLDDFYHIIAASDVERTILNTRSLIKNKRVEEIKLDMKEFVDVRDINIKEWHLQLKRNPDGLTTSGHIYNMFAKDKEDAPFITDSIRDVAKQSKMIDLSFVMGYLVERPDNSKQSVLVLSLKDSINFYFLNKDGTIEWVPVSLRNVGIEKKPALSFQILKDYAGRGPVVIALIYDKDNVDKNSVFLGSKIAIVFAYLEPEKTADTEKGMKAYYSGSAVARVIRKN